MPRLKPRETGPAPPPGLTGWPRWRWWAERLLEAGLDCRPAEWPEEVLANPFSRLAVEAAIDRLKRGRRRRGASDV